MKRPELARPFKVPGGHVGAYLTVLPIFCVTIVAFWVGNVADDEVLGIKYFNLYSFLFVFLVGAVANVAYVVWLSYNDRKYELYRDGSPLWPATSPETA